MAGYLQENTSAGRSKPVTVVSLMAQRRAGDKITMLTCYDASFAALMDRCGIDVLLVGDSLGMVCQGRDSTLAVSVADICYHTACVARGNHTALLVADMPFGSYATPQTAFAHAVLLMQAGAHVVKLEGGAWLADTVRFLTERGVPVCAHLGLTPQSVHQLGGFRVQGKSLESAEQLKQDALALQTAGASLLVLEAIPAALGKATTDALSIPTIGIGAGPDCSGQVLVMHDMLGINTEFKPRFLRQYLNMSEQITGAVKQYITDVKSKDFPNEQEQY